MANPARPNKLSVLFLLAASLTITFYIFGCGASGEPGAANNEDAAPSAETIATVDEPTPKEVADYADYGDIASGEFDYSTEFLPIVWGIHSMNKTSPIAYPDASKIAETINKRFNVGIDTLLISSYDFLPLMIEEGRLPDIFYNRGINLSDLIKSGAVKKVPWDLIKKYAPRYYALLGQKRKRRANTKTRRTKKTRTSCRTSSIRVTRSSIIPSTATTGSTR